MRPLSLSAPVSPPEQRLCRRGATASTRNAPRSTPCPGSGDVRGPAGGGPAGARSSIDTPRALDVVAQDGRVTRSPAAELRRRCAPALAEVTFPAARWQLVIAAELYGADADTRVLLGRLPVRTYPSLTAVIATLMAQVAPRPHDEHASTVAP